MLDDGLGRLQLIEVRPDRAGRVRRLQRVTARAFGLEDRLAVVAELLRRGLPTALTRNGRDVRGDVLRVLAHDEVLRHRRRRHPDLVEHDVLDRALLEPLLLVGGERFVQVRADRPLRPRRGEDVAAPAFRLEERRAVLLVGGGRRLAARAAARQQRENAEKRKGLTH